MAFQNFTFPQIVQDLGLVFADADLFSQVAPASVRPEFLAQVIEGADLASAINTEKARSEFVIAPVLFELRRQHKGRFGLFSGVDLNADAARGRLGRDAGSQPHDHARAAAVGERMHRPGGRAALHLKRARGGIVARIAAMVAAQLVNQAAAVSVRSVYGAVTTGSAWKFLRLQDEKLTLDLHEYRLEGLDKILGILWNIVEIG